MKVITLTGVLIVSALLSACGSGGFILATTRGSGNLTSESRQISSITGVELDTSGDLTLTQGDSESLTIEAEDNLLPLLTSEVVNGTLKLSTKPNTSISATKPIKYTLTVKNIAALIANGSGSITSSDLVSANGFEIALSGSGSLNLSSLKSDKVSVSLNGSGSADIDMLNAQSLDANLSGNGALQVAGTTPDQHINLSGSGDFHGDNLVGKTGVATANGSGSITLQVSDKLIASSNGSGDITYIGHPAITQQGNGSGNIRQKS
jgi:hypothetical protein